VQELEVVRAAAREEQRAGALEASGEDEEGKANSGAVEVGETAAAEREEREEGSEGAAEGQEGSEG
jgi:hypothetical protein